MAQYFRNQLRINVSKLQIVSSLYHLMDEDSLDIGELCEVNTDLWLGSGLLEALYFTNRYVRSLLEGQEACGCNVLTTC